MGFLNETYTIIPMWFGIGKCWYLSINRVWGLRPLYTRASWTTTVDIECVIGWKVKIVLIHFMIKKKGNPRFLLKCMKLHRYTYLVGSWAFRVPTYEQRVRIYIDTCQTTNLMHVSLYICCGPSNGPLSFYTKLEAPQPCKIVSLFPTLRSLDDLQAPLETCINNS